MTPLGSLTSKTDLDTKLLILSALIQKLWSMMSFSILVNKITVSNIIVLMYWKALAQAILCKNLATFCPSITQIYGPKCDFAKVMTLTDQGHRSKLMAPSDALTSKGISRHHNRAFESSKVMAKELFCITVVNATCSHSSHVQTTQNVFWLIKGPNQSYHVLKFRINLFSRNDQRPRSLSISIH